MTRKALMREGRTLEVIRIRAKSPGDANLIGRTGT
jgi:hypothetical protein